MPKKLLLWQLGGVVVDGRLAWPNALEHNTTLTLSLFAGYLGCHNKKRGIGRLSQERRRYALSATWKLA